MNSLSLKMSGNTAPLGDSTLVDQKTPTTPDQQAGLQAQAAQSSEQALQPSSTPPVTSGGGGYSIPEDEVWSSPRADRGPLETWTTIQSTLPAPTSTQAGPQGLQASSLMPTGLLSLNQNHQDMFSNKLDPPVPAEVNKNTIDPESNQSKRREAPTGEDHLSNLGTTAAKYNPRARQTTSQCGPLTSFSSLRQGLSILHGPVAWNAVPESSELKILLNRFMTLIQGYSALKRITNDQTYERYTKGLTKIIEASTNLPQRVDEITSMMEASIMTDQLKTDSKSDVNLIITKAQEIMNGLEGKISEWDSILRKEHLQRTTTLHRPHYFQNGEEMPCNVHPEQLSTRSTPLASYKSYDYHHDTNLEEVNEVTGETRTTTSGVQGNCPIDKEEPTLYKEHLYSTPSDASQQRDKPAASEPGLSSQSSTSVHGPPPYSVHPSPKGGHEHQSWCVCETCLPFLLPPKYHTEYPSSVQNQMHKSYRIDPEATTNEELDSSSIDDGWSSQSESD